MKRSTLFSFLLIGLVSITAIGCKKRGVGITPIPGRDRVAQVGRSGDLGPGLNYNDPGRDLLFDETTGLHALSDRLMNEGPQDRSVLQAATIYFDVDSSTVTSTERPKLQDVVSYLRSNPNHDVLVEGHCDERGTEGYNQSLGERRASAAREALIEMGAPAGNIFTTSYGESRPAVPGTGEAAWRQNRRAEFVVVLPAQ